ncbi:MAG: hypothetical protein JXR63_13370 [Spirochaetales bacterium]|nr:hypothetical protein [Spirochaetales bacterium]
MKKKKRKKDEKPVKQIKFAYGIALMVFIALLGSSGRVIFLLYNEGLFFELKEFEIDSKVRIDLPLPPEQRMKIKKKEEDSGYFVFDLKSNYSSYAYGIHSSSTRSPFFYIQIYDGSNKDLLNPAHRHNLDIYLSSIVGLYTYKDYWRKSKVEKSKFLKTLEIEKEYKDNCYIVKYWGHSSIHSNKKFKYVAYVYSDRIVFLNVIPKNNRKLNDERIIQFFDSYERIDPLPSSPYFPESD